METEGRLSRAIAPAQIEIKQIRGDVDAHDVLDASRTNELAMALIRQSEQLPRQPKVTRLSQTVVEQLLVRAVSEGDVSASARQRVAIERERNGKWFGPYDGEISDPDLRQMLARHFGPEHIYSASRLSSYGNCAFRFFASRVLRLEPRTEAALDLQLGMRHVHTQVLLRRARQGEISFEIVDIDLDERSKLRRILAGQLQRITALA